MNVCVECPYCGYENDMTDDLIELNGNEFDTECVECKEEFEVYVEFDPSFTVSKIVFEKCQQCGSETRDICKRGSIFPYPSHLKDKVCRQCYRIAVIEYFRDYHKGVED
ncbi:hypothetical protein [Virgibacillus salexigens]|uniref:Uncharacterized protein n=1 Tax=Virgibacillus massiliensis TaxID=1462526 RepID=A0A024QI63_9BACI|nr:hypothetical protein [Virgibacillus massiliensis]CDQ41880.1 hypothetical protein BN990_04259 [Virgibacillus massiliensis]